METYTLRQYLNGEFYDSFNEADKARIAETRLANDNNQWFGTSGGNETSDRIFLLSLEEVVKYFGDSGQLRNRPSNEIIDDQYNSERIATDANGGASEWRLRSPGSNSDSAALVLSVGRVLVRGYVIYANAPFRPALWLNL